MKAFLPPSLSLLVTLLVASVSRAELLVVANDAKAVMVNGRQGNVPNPPPDTLALIDLGVSPPRLVAEIPNVPSSITGPPVGLAVTPDEGLALVVSATKPNPETPARSMADDRLTVVDLKARSIVATLQTGTTPTGVAINRQGTLALVGSRTGAITIFRIEGKNVVPAGKFQVPGEPVNLSNLAFAPDGKSVTAAAGDKLIFLTVDGTQLAATTRALPLGMRPYTVDFARDGKTAAFTVIGNPNGGTVEKVGVVDLQSATAAPVTVTVGGPTPESVRFSPDGTLCVVVEFNGTTRAPDAPTYSARGKLELYRRDGASLTRVAEAPIGGWAQCAVFSADNKTLLVTNCVEHEVQVFRWDGRTLTSQMTIKMKGAPVLMATAAR